MRALIGVEYRSDMVDVLCAHGLSSPGFQRQSTRDTVRLWWFLLYTGVMLNLFQSNRMTELASVFCSRNNGILDPFVPLTVIVQSFGLGQWLKLQMAEREGIAANIDDKLPAAFLWQFYQHLMPELRDLRQSPYERHRLVWRIMRLLKDNPGLSGAVRNYLEAPGDTDLRLFQLASELTLLLDEYLMYRPDWINRWESDDYEALGHEQWQRDLWRLTQTDLRDSNYLHRAELHQRAMLTLNANSELPWRRLSIFGLSTMPPLQLETFRAIARHCEVDIYFLNPCEHYWGDIVSPRDLARRSVRALINPDEQIPDEDYLEVGNPLLSSLGKQGRELLEMMLETPEVQSVESFMRSDTSDALGFVKNDILDLTFGGEFGFGETPPRQSLCDDSLQVHVCHSRLREVEVLKDQILRQIEINPGIRLSDILVMVPDIADYAPFIRAVFTGDFTYRLRDTSSLEHSTLLTGFLSLMNLPESRFTGPQVMDLLEVPAIMRRLKLGQEDLETLSHWINGAGIRWELDGSSKESRWSLPPKHQNTWRFGLDRLLLGFAMEEQKDTWQDILPFDVDPAETVLLGKLCDFIDLLAGYRDQLNVSHSAADWFTIITRMVNEFFAPTGNENLEISQLLEMTEELTTRAGLADYTDPLSGQMVSHAIRKMLTGQGQRAGFISGGITFATLVPMRSIPFRLVCLLGMNDSDYPRDTRPHSFDLIADSTHRKGDRSKKLDDRYLFLEALMSARDTFYVSYVGRSARDNKVRPPSVVVQEWLGYLDAVFESPNVTQHTLQPFNTKYYRGDRLQSFNDRWYQALTSDKGKDNHEFLGTPLPVDDTMRLTSIDQLGAFYRHTARYFLRQRLGIYLDSDEVDLQDTESFELDPLARFRLADAALNQMMEGGDVQDFRQRILRSGQVLPGEVGRQHLDREIRRADNIKNQVEPYLTEQRQPLSVELTIGPDVLSFEPFNLYGNRLVHYRVGMLRPQQLLAAWISHLAANIAQPGTDSVFVFRGSRDEAKAAQLAAVDDALARQYLEMLVNGYHQSLDAPPFLPSEATHEYATALLKDGDANQAMRKARQVWERNPDRYWQRLFRTPEAFDNEFAEAAIRLWQPLLERFSDE